MLRGPALSLELRGGGAHAHLAGVARAVFRDVTVVHRISAHNSHELHLQQRKQRLNSLYDTMTHTIIWRSQGL